MSSTFGRMRSKEAPMSGLEFTHRTNTIPAWRLKEEEVSQQTPLKRSHSTANPPPSPFTPKRPDSKPVFGDDVRYLFSPHISMTPAPEAPEVDMKDPDVSPSPHRAQAQASLKDKEDDKENADVRPMSNAAVRRVDRARRKMANRERGSRSMMRRMRGSRVDEGDVNSEDEDDDGDGDDEYDDDGSPRRRNGFDVGRVTRKTSNHYTLNMPGPVLPKSDTPYVLLGYVQFLFNLSLVLVFLYLLLQFILTVQRDVEQRISEYSMEILQDISTCTTLFKTNRCDNPIPAMTHQCAAWETCMNRDPRVVGRARVGAEMLAEVVNGFVEPISWKTLAFTLSSLTFLTIFVNALLSLYRTRYHPDKLHTHPNSHHTSQNSSLPPHQQQQLQHPTQPPYPYGYPHLPPPITMMGWHPTHTGPGTGMNMNSMGLGASGWRPDEGIEELPTRRRRLDNGDKKDL